MLVPGYAAPCHNNYVRSLLIVIAVCASASGADLTDRFFDEYLFKFYPTQGTAAGFHQYDSQLEDYSSAGVRQRAQVLHQFESEFEKQPKSDDRDLILGKIRADLLELEDIRQWQKNPDVYSSGLTSSIYVIMSRSFAPPEQRLRSVIARERQANAVFAAAKQNITNPPKIYTDIAIEQLPGIISFFRVDVPKAFLAVRGAQLLAEFHSANNTVIDLLTGYQTYLKTNVAPRSHGDFRIGAENYRKKLAYDEMVDTPLDELLKIGYANLRQNQAEFRRIAARIDPQRTPSEILHQLEKEHPAPGSLLQAFRDVLSGLRDFIIQHKIVDIPSPVMPIVEATPPFMTALTFASMDTPGPYETVAKEAYFNVTLPEAGWPRQRTEEHMEAFNRGTVISTAIHEAYPGHYVQFLWLQHVPSKVRKLIGAASNAEGWAHYCEQMMLDEGYSGGDPKLRLGQLQDALLRNARYVVGIEMHTGKMTYDQGIDFFVKEGYQTRANGERETSRGTADPTYLYYTLGKLEILKLREDYKKIRGASFSLEQFHDEFLKQGFPPVKLIRRAMLGNDSPVLSSH